jgi:dipeptidyl aminopeptidase/acylaminoacyl peptidase
MIGKIERLLRRLHWRHLIWLFVLAGLTYVSLPFFYAAGYTWRLLHPQCRETFLDTVQGDWRSVEDDEATSFSFWYVPPNNNRVVLLIGGREGTLLDWQPEIEALLDEGYGVAVLPDPGCNLHTATLGAQEKEQISAVVNYLTDIEQVEWIGAAGFSAGASALALAVPQTESLQAVVLMGNYSDLQFEMMYTPYQPGSIGWLGQHALPFWYWGFTGIRVKEVSPLAAYDEYKGVNVLMIHGEYEAQRTQAENQLTMIRNNKDINADLWIVPQAYHGMYYDAAGETYLKRVVDFFNEGD